MMKDVASELNSIREKGLYRHLQAPEGLDFFSNDFFGLSRSPEIRAAVLAHLESGSRLGSTGSRLVSGESVFLRDAEQWTAAHFRAPATLFFGSGYLANLGVTGALAGPDTEFFSDALNHASLIDGMRLAAPRRDAIRIFRHNDLEHLERLLREGDRGGTAENLRRRRVVVSESVFSMDGDGPNLVRLKEICDRHEAYLILDEAHATGILGSSGRGGAEGVGFDFSRTLIVHTCGKALGGYGAFVTTSVELRELMINKSRSFIYSTGPAPLQVAQTRAALAHLHSRPELREALWRNIALMRRALPDALRPQTSSAFGHIIALHLNGNERVVAAESRLKQMGLAVKAIRFPTVAVGRERLRLTLKSFHGEEEMKRLLHALREAVE